MKHILKNFNSKIVHLASLQFFLGATLAAFHPFLVVFLISKGFDSITIGIILALNSFVTVFALPFWGIMSDRLRSVKKVFIVCIIVSTCIFLFLPFYGSAFIIGLLLGVFTFFRSPILPLQTSWIIQEIKTDKKIAFGNIRLWRSVSFAIAAYVLGRTIEATSVYIIFPVYAVFSFIALMIAVKIKEAKPDQLVAPTSLSDLKIGRLVKNYRYVTYLLFAVILLTPLRGAMGFLPMLVEEVGGTSGDIGMAIFVSRASEIPVFLSSKYLIAKFKPIHLIFISTVFFTIRQILFVWANTPFEVIFLQVLQGPSFALFLIGVVYYIDSLAPRELRATAQTVAAAVSFGGSGIIGSLGGGWFIDNFSLTQMYQVGVLMTLGISLMFIFSFFVNSKLLMRSKVPVRRGG